MNLNAPTILYQIDVDNLFGVFNHSIQFKKGGITIILGENGLGKTVILKILKDFFSHNFDDLGKYEFTKIRLFFTSNVCVSITKIVTDVNDCTLRFNLIKEVDSVDNEHEIFEYDYIMNAQNRNNRGYVSKFKYKLQNQTNLFYNEDLDFFADDELSRYLPEFIIRDGMNSWLDMRTNRLIGTDDLLLKFKHHFPVRIREMLLSQKRTDLPNWLIEIAGPVNAKLVETQRLLISLEEDKYRSSVLKFSTQLVETIKMRRSIATDLASKLDRTYTNRLIDKFSVSNRIKIRELLSNLALLELQREFLNNVGLLDIDEEYIQPINNAIFEKPELKVVLQIYIEDSTQKLSIYNELGMKIKVFLDIINKRFKNKKLSINKTDGLVFKSTVKDKDIPLSGLSSGEQHLIVLFFELIFNTDAQSMLLIDEPEISLHITWQKEFIQDLTEIIKLNNLNVVIATHSPDIIGNAWNLTTSLTDQNAF